MSRVHRVAALVLVSLLSSCANRPETKSEVGPSTASSAAHAPEGAQSPAAVEPPARVPVIIQGTGELIGPTSGAKVSTPPSSGDGFQLGFVDTDIAAVLGAVLGEGLNVPFVIDPQIKGTLTLQATRPLSRDELLVALETALRVQGIAMVNVNGAYQIVPAKEATRRVTSLQSSKRAAKGFGIHVVPLQYVSAAEMGKILQPFAPEGGILRVDESRNLLLLAGTSQEITTLLSVVKTFDVDWLAGMSFALFPLEYVDAKTLATELEQVFTANKSPIAGVVRFVPLSRLNSLMVVTPQAKYLQDVESWIKRLDLGLSTPGRRIYVYDVQNGKADDLAESLNSILSLSGSFDSALNEETPQNNSAQADVRPATRAAPSAVESGTLKIVPSAENNSLLVFASPSEFAVIEAALKRLDVLPIQVLIEASIAEVTLTDDLRYGLQWAYRGGDGPIVLSESSSGAIDPVFPGFSYLFTGRADIRAVLSALESLTNVKVLSSPKLMVLNNREAQLQIGDQVPITVQTAISTNNSDAPIVNSVQLRDTGVILRVTPRANKSGRVIIEVAQEVSDVVPTTTSNIDSPTIQQRKLASTVAVRDGETIALGGLIRDSRSRTRAGVPYLRRLPVLGELFGSTDKRQTRTELIVLLTPRVIRSEQESEDVMNELKDQFRSLERLLPEWNPKTTESR
jgi:general secretion pathway protein D